MSLDLPYITDFTITPKGKIGLSKYLTSVLSNLPENWTHLKNEDYLDVDTFHILNTIYCIETIYEFDKNGFEHKAKLYIGVKDERALLLSIKFQKEKSIEDKMNNINFILYWFHYFILRKNKYYKEFNHQFELGGPMDENWNISDIRDLKSIKIASKNEKKTAFFSKGATAKVGDKELYYFIPNSIALTLSITKKSYKRAKKIHKAILSKGKTKTIKLKQEDKPELYDYFEEIITSITFAFISVEAMANTAIPENFIKEINNNKGVKETWTKENIERWMSTGQKISEILPEIFKSGDIKKEVFWHKFVQLEKLRNDIVHQKTLNEGVSMDNHMYSIMLENSVFDKIKSSFSVIEYFYKFNSSHPYFPLGLGIAKMKFDEVDSFDQFFDKLNPA